MSGEEEGMYGRLPQDFRDNPRAYDLWQAYVFLESCAVERRGDGWSFGFPASQSFPASEIEGIGREEDALRLDLNLSGFLGPDGPLPPTFRETVIQERNGGNRALQDFLDLFQNRLMRLWMEEASAMCPELGAAKEEGEAPAAVRACAADTMPAEAVSLDAELFRGAWAPLPESFRTRLGTDNSRLGADMLVGKSVFDAFGRILLRAVENNGEYNGIFF